MKGEKGPWKEILGPCLDSLALFLLCSFWNLALVEHEGVRSVLGDVRRVWSRFLSFSSDFFGIKEK